MARILSHSSSPAAKMKADAQFTQKIIIGIGCFTSDTIGAIVVIRWLTRFTMPNTEVTNSVGKSLATLTYPML